MSPKEFFSTKLPQLIKENPQILKECELKNFKVCLEIEGSQGGAWTLEFDHEGSVALQHQIIEAQCMVCTKDETFHGMMKGEVNVPLALMMRKIKIKGDPMVAAKVGKALRALQ